jgi:hypothetical protein
VSEPVDHAKARAEIQPLTDALVNIVTELALLTPVQRSTVLRMINAAYAVPEPSTSPLDLFRGGGQISGGLGLSAKQQGVLDGMTPIGAGGIMYGGTK